MLLRNAMKRSFATPILLLTFLAGGMFGYAPTAHAQSCKTDSECGQGKWCEKIGADSSGTCVVGTPPAPEDGAANTPTGFNGSFDNVKSLNGVMGIIMQLFAWLLGTAGLVLDKTVYLTVVTMGDYVNGLSAIGVAWRILRDIGNIILIFGFLAIGISTILSVETYGVKKMLPKLLLAAVFLNFSLFIAEAVIDVGNVFATQFYTAINAGKGAGGDVTIGNEGISNALMNQLGLQQMYGVARNNQTIFEGNTPFLVGFMAILLFMIAAFVMFSLAFILIARFVALVFIIVVAPIGFAGLAVPQLKGLADQWWHQLFAQTITAPALLLLLYVALAVITDVNFLVGFKVSSGNALTDWLKGGGGLAEYAGMMLAFLVAMGLLLAVMYFAKKLGAAGAGVAMKLGGLASFGTASLAGRGFLGLAGAGLSNKRMKAWASRGGAGSRFAKGLVVGGGKVLANRTYDFRNAPGAGSALGALGLSAGKGASLTAKKAVEGFPTPKKVSDYLREGQKENEKAAAELKRKDILTSSSSSTAAIKGEFKKMSPDEIAETAGIRNADPRFIEALTPAQYKDVMASSKLLAGEKTKLKTAWEDQFSSGRAAATMARFSTEEIATLSGDILTKPDVIDELGSTELDAIKTKGTLTKQQRHDIYAHAGISTSFATEMADYLSTPKDPTGARMKYWNV